MVKDKKKKGKGGRSRETATRPSPPASSIMPDAKPTGWTGSIVPKNYYELERGEYSD